MPIHDEFTRRCLSIVVSSSITAERVVEELKTLFEKEGVPGHIRSDNGPEYMAKKVRSLLRRKRIEPLFIAPGSPRENGIQESFNARLRDEALHREEFWSILEAVVEPEEFKF